MSIIDKIIKKDTTPIVDPNKLSTQELQLILTLLKQSTIKGDQVELFYSSVIKLQNQYTDQAKN